MSSEKRKASRWSQPGPNRFGSHKKVTDQEAMNALLSSAEARQREREERPRKQRKHGDDNNRKHGRRTTDNSLGSRDSYYGPEARENQSDPQNNESEELVQKQKPNFALSGALSKDEHKGNTYKGVVLKFSEPPEARAPNTQWRLYVYKGDDHVETLHIARQSAYLFGRNEEIADIPLLHASCSSQHAVLQYRAVPKKDTGKLQCCPYLMDLESTNGSFLNGVKLEAARYYQLKKGDVLKFGASTRDYVLLTENTTSI